MGEEISRVSFVLIIFTTWGMKENAVRVPAKMPSNDNVIAFIIIPGTGN